MRTRIATLRDAGRAACASSRSLPDAEAVRSRAQTVQSADAAARDAEECGDGGARLEGGVAQKSEIDDEHEQRGNFENRFRQRGAEESRRSSLHSSREQRFHGRFDLVEQNARVEADDERGDAEQRDAGVSQAR